MTFKKLLLKITDGLKIVTENARGEAWMILCEITKLSREEIISRAENDVPPEIEERVFSMVARRAAREPLQYILGGAWFWGREFFVTDGVLIPRPETELLVEAALEKNFGAFLDWGTGSGCIGITLMREREGSFGVLAEKNPRSVLCAWKNLKKFNLLSRCLLWHSRHPSDIPARKVDLIVSNPPYIRSGDIKSLMPEVLREPVLALDGGHDGLDFYRLILNFAPRWLKENGRLIFEIGEGQSLFFKENTFDRMELKYIRTDYAGIERVVCYEKIKPR